MLVFFAGPALLADTILLRNGRRIEGTILSQNRKRVLIRTARGVRQIDKRRIRRVKYGKLAPAAKVRPKAAKKEAPKEPAKKEPRPAPKEPEQKRPPSGSTTVTRGAILWRSALLPGWGHMHSERTRWGWSFGAAFFLSAGAAAYSGGQTAAARSDYEAGVTQSLVIAALAGQSGASAPLLHFVLSDAGYGSYDSSARATTALWQFAGLVYLVQLGHAALFGSAGASATGTARTPPAYGLALERDRTGNRIVRWEVRQSW